MADADVRRRPRRAPSDSSAHRYVRPAPEPALARGDDILQSMRVLFVCRGNVCRSRVGEQIFQVLSWSVARRGEHEARSAGVDPDPGGRPVTSRDLAWASVICVMEPEHEAYIRKHWPAYARKVRVLGIPDVYEPDDPELRDRLTEVVRGLLAEA